jgi:hypothetical protein
VCTCKDGDAWDAATQTCRPVSIVQTGTIGAAIGRAFETVVPAPPAPLPADGRVVLCLAIKHPFASDLKFGVILDDPTRPIWYLAEGLGPTQALANAKRCAGRAPAAAARRRTCLGAWSVPASAIRCRARPPSQVSRPP